VPIRKRKTMKKRIRFIYIVYILFNVSGSVFGIGESSVIIGGKSSWGVVENKAGITELQSVRPYPVLALSSAVNNSITGYSAATGVLGNFAALTESAFDLSVSFDEKNAVSYRDNTGNYKISISGGIEAVNSQYARSGTGAALFNGNGIISIEPENRNALFSSGSRIRDFTIEFWLYPLNFEDGEKILSWVSVKPQNRDYTVQRINCTALKNRLSWSFDNFFTSVSGSSSVNIELSGSAPVIPKIWSHHLLRFDASTGMVEYIVNGSSEAIVYATLTGRENNDVYTPVAGNNGTFTLGERFTGLLDEFKIHNVFAGRSSMQKYLSSGGRMETRAIDLGDNYSKVVRVNVSGGRINISGKNFNNEFRENGKMRFKDNSEMNFFIRSCENPYLINGSTWITFTPGAEIPDITGRYVQLAVDFYPSADGETSPYLNELSIIYLRGEPPMPPKNLTAIAVDSGVLLRWKPSPSPATTGYLIYYSSAREELFGNDALLGSSPINAGKKESLFIDGLKNGTLYYFRIAAYDNVSGTYYNTGEFSVEVMARPLAGLLLSGIYE
jgi:hypothetical protein